MIRDVVVNVVANLLAAAILTAIAGILWVIFTRPRVRRLHMLFGVGAENSKISIYLSNLSIQAGGAQSRLDEQDVEVGFTGPAIIRSEFRSAELLESVLRGRRLVSRPQRLNAWLQGSMPSLSVPDVIIDVAPDPFEQRAAENLVLIGSRVYNSLTAHYFEGNPSSYFSFGRIQVDENQGSQRTISIVGREQPVPVTRAPYDGRGTELAIIERLVDEANQRIIFAVYGFGAAASAGAVRFLAEQWKDLASLRERSGERVGLLLAFDDYPRDIRRGEELDVLHNRPRVLIVRTPSNVAELEPGKQTLQDYLAANRVR